MKNKTVFKQIVGMCLSMVFVVMMGTTSSFAKAPSIETKFQPLYLGTNQMKDGNFTRDTSVLAGCFTAPENGKYKITAVNNGEDYAYAYLLDRDYADVDFGFLAVTDKKEFDTRYLSKNEKIYIYAEDGLSGLIEPRLVALRVIISKDEVKQASKPKVTKKTKKKVKLNKTKLTLKKGKKYKLKLKNNKKKVTWTSTKKSVAKVSSKGVVKAKKKGKTRIRAKVGKKVYTCKVTVKK